VHCSHVAAMTSAGTSIDDGPTGIALEGKLNSNEAAADKLYIPTDAERYENELAQLADMGFEETSRSLKALIATNGNVHAAVDHLIAGMAGPPPPEGAFSSTWSVHHLNDEVLQRPRCGQVNPFDLGPCAFPPVSPLLSPRVLISLLRRQCCAGALSEELFHEWASENTKQCPSCGTPVEKNGGCDTISCRCGTRFCYKCGYGVAECSTKGCQILLPGADDVEALGRDEEADAQADASDDNTCSSPVVESAMMPPPRSAETGTEDKALATDWVDGVSSPAPGATSPDTQSVVEAPEAAAAPMQS